MSNFTFPAEAAIATTAHVKRNHCVRKERGQNAGRIPRPKNSRHAYDFAKSKDSTCPSQEWYDGQRDAIVAGFTPDEKRILKAPTASLDDAGKKEKAKVQAKIGSVKDIKNGLLRNPDGKTPVQPKTGLDKASTDFLAYLGKVQKYEDMPFDVVELIALLKAMGNKFSLK
jgi:hypothetical protein